MTARDTVAVLLLAVTALVGLQAEAQSSDHARVLNHAIERVVAQYAFLTVFDEVSVKVDSNGIAVLVRSVTSRSKRTELAKRVGWRGLNAVVQSHARCLRRPLRGVCF